MILQGKNQTKKELVQVLPKHAGENYRDIIPNVCISIRIAVIHYCRNSPKVELRKDGGKLVLKKGTVYSNPYSNLRAWLAKGNKLALFDIYFQKLEHKNLISNLRLTLKGSRHR